MTYEWDPAKAAANLKKHGVRFADAALSLEDPRCLVMEDLDSEAEARLLGIGADPEGRLLVTVFTYRGKNLRIISSRKGTRTERRAYGSQL